MNYGLTRIVVCSDAAELGARAAADVSARMRELLAGRDEIRMIFAAAESQMAFLDELARAPGIDWQRVVCFNMDDFHQPGMPPELTCGHQTRRQLYDVVNPKRFEVVRFDAPDAGAEAARYEAVFREAGPPDILCQGIGTSGHLALDEPGQADFETDALVKVVDIDEQSRRQLMTDPNFRALGTIPARGITLTIPAMLRAPHVFTMVHFRSKRDIITRLLATAEPTTDLPASILSRHEGVLYLDRESCPADPPGGA